MHITMVTGAMHIIGGTETHLRDLSHGLLARGHDISIVTATTGIISDELEKNGVRIVKCPKLIAPMSQPVAYAQSALELTGLLKKLSPDIVHSHGVRPHLPTRIASRMLSIPTVHTVHGWLLNNKRFSLGKTVKTTSFKLGEFIGNGQTIYVSDDDRQFGIRNGYSNDNNSHLVYNGIPDVPDALRANFQQARGTDPVRLIMVARLSKPHKDHETPIKALAQLKNMNWTIDFVGAGDPAEYIELAEQLGVADRCNFVGEVNDVQQRLAKADIFLLTSQFEGLPVAVSEAMRAGLPVIANDINGNREMVSDNVNGFLVPYADTANLRDAMTKLIESSHLRQQMGKIGRAMFEDKFGHGNMVRRMTETYDHTIEAHTRHLPRPAFFRPQRASGPQ